jgi:hypothetical protein
MTELAKPEGVSTWNWLRPEFEDLSHWQNCIVAAANADAKNILLTARGMYIRQGGKIKVTKSRKLGKPIKSYVRDAAEVAMLKNHPALAATRVCWKCMKKIGDAAYEVDADAIVTHFACKESK